MAELGEFRPFCRKHLADLGVPPPPPFRDKIRQIVFERAPFTGVAPIINETLAVCPAATFRFVYLHKPTNKQHHLTQTKDTTLDCERLTSIHIGDCPSVPF